MRLQKYIKVERNGKIIYLFESEWYALTGWEREKYIYIEKVGYLNITAAVSRFLFRGLEK